LVADTPPKDADVAVQYDRKWFWIADNLTIIMLLFSMKSE